MLAYIRKIANRDEGAAGVEYGLLVAAIAAVIILVVFAIGTWVKGAFDKTCDGFASGATGISGSACP